MKSENLNQEGQEGYKPFLQRDENGKIKSVLPYLENGLFGLFDKFNDKIGSHKTVKCRKDFGVGYDINKPTDNNK